MHKITLAFVLYIISPWHHCIPEPATEPLAATLSDGAFEDLMKIYMLLVEIARGSLCQKVLFKGLSNIVAAHPFGPWTSHALNLIPSERQLHITVVRERAVGFMALSNGAIIPLPQYL